MMKPNTRFTLTDLLRLFSPPVLEDESQNRRMQIAYYAFLLGFGVCSYMTILFISRWDLLNIFASGGTMVMVSISIVLLRRKQLIWGITLTTGYAYLAVLIGTAYGAGLQDTGVQAIYPIIMVIAILQKRRAMWIYGALTLVWILIIIYLDLLGIYNNVGRNFSPISEGILTASLFILTLMILFFIVQNTVVANEKLQKAKLEAEEANRLKSLFLANMSHELRTPLNAIIGYSEAILETADEDKHLDIETVDDVVRINQSGRHLLTLINDILDLSKIEANRANMNIHHFILADLLTEVVETIGPMSRKNRNHLVLENRADQAIISTDRQKLRQILLNLLSNAAKFTEDGTITLQVSMVEGIFYFTVSDTGVGIPQDQLGYIFDSFRQVDNSHSRPFGGTGLGLAITRRLCELLTGSIEVESEEGVGSTFRVSVPNLSLPDTVDEYPINLANLPSKSR